MLLTTKGYDGLVPHNDLCKYGATQHKGEPGEYHYCTKFSWHRELMSSDGLIAVGLLDDGEIDEILYEDNVTCHLESMGPDNIWMMLNDRYVFHFWYKKGRQVALTYSYDNKGGS